MRVDDERIRVDEVCECVCVVQYAATSSRRLQKCSKLIDEEWVDLYSIVLIVGVLVFMSVEPLRFRTEVLLTEKYHIPYCCLRDIVRCL